MFERELQRIIDVHSFWTRILSIENFIRRIERFGKILNILQLGTRRYSSESLTKKCAENHIFVHGADIYILYTSVYLIR